MLILIVTLN